MRVRELEAELADAHQSLQETGERDLIVLEADHDKKNLFGLLFCPF